MTGLNVEALEVRDANITSVAWAAGARTLHRGSTSHTMGRTLRLAAAISFTAILGLMIPARAQ
jgi:hypothetical protein